MAHYSIVRTQGFRHFLSLFVLLFGISGIAHAGLLTFQFADPVDDETGAINPVDLTSMVFTFDNTTGAFSIQFTATAANPFAGDFRINVNLFNPDTGFGNANFPAFFADDVNDFFNVAPTTTFTLTGTNSALTFWSAGNRVATDEVPFGSPSGVSGFTTEELSLVFGSDLLGTESASDFTTISAAEAPEPATLWLVGACLCTSGLVINSRRRSRRHQRVDLVETDLPRC